MSFWNATFGLDGEYVLTNNHHRKIKMPKMVDLNGQLVENTIKRHVSNYLIKFTFEIDGDKAVLKKHSGCGIIQEKHRKDSTVSDKFKSLCGYSTYAKKASNIKNYTNVLQHIRSQTESPLKYCYFQSCEAKPFQCHSLQNMKSHFQKNHAKGTSIDDLREALKKWIEDSGKFNREDEFIPEDLFEKLKVEK